MKISRRKLFCAIGGMGASRGVCSAAASPVVETQYGKVRGATARGVQIFASIPYGGPTEGAGRFMPPSQPPKWAGIRDVSKTAPRCIQGEAGKPQGQFTTPVFGAYMAGGKQWPELLQEEESENCLYVNVVTPSVKGKRPVIAYIHGGAFSNGSGLLTVFADAHAREHDLVLVGITHRLNVFGYSYLGGLSDKYKVGNAGQLDLVLALRWIRDNIANFGGDPNSITLWGDSGGGAKICTLMAMPEAQGLFHKAIVSSGSLLRADSPRKGTAGARDMLAKLGLKENQIAELHKLPAQKLYKASKGGWPVVDGHSVPRQTWDPQAPEGSANVAMIVGHCSHETSVFAATGQPQMLELDEAGLRASLVKANIPGAEVGNVIALYRRDHPKEPPSALYFRIMADRGARTNVIAQAERKIEQGKASVYVYQFNWATPVFGGKLFAWHTAEMPLAARIVLYPESDQLSKQISGAYAAFARTGSPNGGGLPEWPAYTTTRRATMIWDIPKSEAVNDPDPQERRLIAKYPSGSLL